MPRGRFTAEQVADLLVGTDSDVEPFGSEEDDPKPAQATFTHGDSTAENDDDGHDVHLDAEANGMQGDIGGDEVVSDRFFYMSGS